VNPMPECNGTQPPPAKKRIDPIRLGILIGLVFFFFSVPLVFYPWVTTFVMAKETVAQLLLLVIAACWAIWVAGEGKRFSLKTPLTIPIIVLAGTILLSLINTEDSFASSLGLALWGSYFLLYFIVISVVGGSRWSKILLGAALSAGFLAATYCIFQFYGVDFFFWAELGGRGRLFSSFGNPNYLAGYLIACLPPAFVLLTALKSRWKKIILLTTIVVLYTSLLMTYTRAAWVGFFVSILFTVGLLFFWQGKRFLKENRYWLAVLTSLLLAITVIYSVPNPLNGEGRSVVGRVASSLDLSSYASRSLIWLSAIEIVKEHPIIGAGIGTLGVNYPAAQGKVLAQARYARFIPQANFSINAHNDLLHMWAEIGILGLLCAAWIIIAFYKGALLSLRRLGTERRLLLIGFVGGALAILVHSVFSFPFHVIPNGLLFWLYLALSWVTIRQSGAKREESRVESLEPGAQDPEPKPQKLRRKNLRPILRWGIVAVVIGVIVFLGMARARLFQADMYLKQGKMLIEAGLGEDPGAMAALEIATTLEPHYGKAYAYLGMVYAEARRYDEAIEAFKKAETNWIEVDHYECLGAANKNAGRLEEAREVFEEGIAIFPNRPTAYASLGDLYRIQAQEQLLAGSELLAASSLDRALFYYEQARVFNRVKPPSALADDYYRMGLRMISPVPEIQAATFFFSRGAEPIVNFLEPVARPGRPILFKLFFYAEGGEFSQGTINIVTGAGESLGTLPLIGSGPVLSGFLEKGPTAGDHLAVVNIYYGDKSLEQAFEFTVTETSLEIADFSATNGSSEKPTVIHLTVRNNGTAAALIVGTVKICDGEGKEVGEIRFPPTLVPPAQEKKVEVSWDQRLQPGLYVVSARLVAVGDSDAESADSTRIPTANGEVFFSVPHS